MKAQNFSLICALALSVSVAAHVQARPKNIYSETTTLSEESPETAAKTDAAISRLSGSCQDMSRKNMEQYHKINDILSGKNLPQEAKQILVDSRSALVWSIESFRQNARNGKKMEQKECQIGIDSLNAMDRQLNQISSTSR